MRGCHTCSGWTVTKGYLSERQSLHPKSTHGVHCPNKILITELVTIKKLLPLILSKDLAMQFCTLPKATHHGQVWLRFASSAHSFVRNKCATTYHVTSEGCSHCPFGSL